MMNTSPETIRDRLEDALLTHQVPPSPELLDTLENLADEAAYPAAADMMAALIGRLDVRQRHLWTALLNQGDALAVIAADVGVTPQAMHRQVDRLRKRLMPRTKPERFTPEEIEAGVELFLRHVPGHVIAAARLAGYPVEGSLRKNDTET